MFLWVDLDKGPLNVFLLLLLSLDFICSDHFHANYAVLGYLLDHCLGLHHNNYVDGSKSFQVVISVTGNVQYASKV